MTQAIARKPIILITTDRRDGQGFHSSPRVRPKRNEAWIYEAYIHAVRAAGGIPLAVPPGEQAIDQLLAVADGIVLTGGDMDIHPSHYGEAVQGRLDRVEQDRTELELGLAKACLQRKIPVLGICGGMQALAVAAGGSLIQDLPTPDTDPTATIWHEQPNDPAESSHPVQLSQDCGLPSPCFANSTHHQAVKHPGSMEVIGRAPDGVIEVIRQPDHVFALGIQWHPELIGQVGPYQRLVDACQPN